MLAGAVNGKEHAAGEATGDFLGRSFEGLRMGAEPDVENTLAADPLIDAAGDGFHFGELGHRTIIASQDLR